MRAVTTQLAEKARTIFDDLGYQVAREGDELRAERKWRSVRISPVEEPTTPPQSGEYRCFVTWADSAMEVRSRLASESPDYEWAVVAVTEDGDYEVLQEPAG